MFVSFVVKFYLKIDSPDNQFTTMLNLCIFTCMKAVIFSVLLCFAGISCAFGGGQKARSQAVTPQAETPQAAASQSMPQPIPEAQVISGSVRLDAAIGDFSRYIAGRRLPDNALTAIAINNTPVERLGFYIADKLTDELLNSAGLRMVSRQDYMRVLEEQAVQAGAFDDDSTAKMGHNLGWRNIIYGTVEPLSDAYHLSLRAVDVQTGELRGSRSYVLIGNDPILVNLVNPNVSVQRLNERETLLTPFNGKQNNFELRVSTNKNVYYDMETMRITLLSNLDCYFVVYHLDVNNNMQVIYPNSLEQGRNTLRAGVSRVIPENSSFVLHEPFGEERILVYASEQPIDIPAEQYQSRSVSGNLITATQEGWHSGSRGMTIRPREATAMVSYSILPR
jgi:hypothetical protein